MGGLFPPAKWWKWSWEVVIAGDNRGPLSKGGRGDEGEAVEDEGGGGGIGGY